MEAYLIILIDWIVYIIFIFWIALKRFSEALVMNIREVLTPQQVLDAGCDCYLKIFELGVQVGNWV
jgi:hypothetical protein